MTIFTYWDDVNREAILYIIKGAKGYKSLLTATPVRLKSACCRYVMLIFGVQ